MVRPARWRILKRLSTVALVTLLLAFAWKARSPALRRVRPLLPVAMVTSGLVVGVALRERTAARLAIAGAAAAAIALGVLHEHRFEDARERVLRASPERLARVGRHLVVGFEDFASLAPLVERGAVGGIFLSTHNVAGRSIEQTRAEIDRLQAIQTGAGRPPLWVMADQEGGRISRLSPPLPQLPPLSSVAQLARSPEERDVLALAFGAFQGAGLAAMGVNLNLGPVVDVPDERSSPLFDPYSRISTRAISRDPEEAAAIATAYARGLSSQGVQATFKHFPGLGTVPADTHFFRARLESSLSQLEARDWVPYHALPDDAAVMVAHVVLPEVDPERIASLSPAVVQGLLRDRLGHQGLVITDDLCMTPVRHSTGGTWRAGREALNAGVDLLLVSYDSDQLFEVMDGLLAADAAGALDPERLERSQARLELASARWAGRGALASSSGQQVR